MIKLGVEAAFFEKCFVCTAFDDLSVFHDENGVRFADGGKTVSNDEARSAFHHGCECVLDLHFRTGIDRGGRFVEDQHRRKRQHDARDAEKLLLTLRKSAVLADLRVVAVRQTLDKAMRVRSLCCRDDLFVRGIGLTHDDVFAYRCGLDPRFLQDHAEAFAQAISRDIADISAVNGDFTAIYVIETHEKTDKGRLTASRRTDDGDAFSAFHRERKITDERLFGIIGERDILDLDIALCFVQNKRIFLVGGLRLCFDKLEKTDRTGERVLKLGRNARNLIEGLGILVGVAEEDRKTTDGERRGIGNDGERADESHACVNDAVDDTGRRIDKGREEYRAERAFFHLTVHILKALHGFFFMTVSTNDLFVTDDLVDIARLRTANLRLRLEKRMGTACDKACRKQGKRCCKDDEKCDLPVDDEHKAECAENGEDACEKLREAHEKSVGKLVGVGDDTADDVAVGMGIAIRNGERLELPECIVADILHDTVGDLVIDDALHPLRERRDDRCDGDANEHGGDLIKRDLAGLDDIIDGVADDDGNVKRQDHGDRRAEKRKEKECLMMANVR